MVGWELISCLPWCNACNDRSTLLIYAGAHTMALKRLMLAQADSMVAGATKGNLRGSSLDMVDHWHLTVPGKMLLQLKPKAIAIGGAGY